MFRLRTTKRSKSKPSITELNAFNNIPLKVIRSSRKSLGIEIKEGSVIVRAPFNCTDRRILEFAEGHRRWIETRLAASIKNVQKARSEGTITPEELKRLSDEAAAVIPEKVRYYADLAGVSYGRITIRHQKTRWGSCSSKGNLNFNCLLMLAPVEVLESVVAHEVCHLKEMNHSDAFYAEVLRIFPEYFKWHNWLKKNGSILLNRLNGIN